MIDYSQINQAVELSKEFKEGAEAFLKGKMPSDNPYRHAAHSDVQNQEDEWLDGWEESFYADNYRNQEK